ncbi:MAG: hypothetical protein AMR96_03050 [Candidatus Adiutrix intracellularis]|jgi:hypothetical protein|nr:MAG: hypothetical protein AMR96_03050 [Candidatus Adiutrix intracellularis]MDR2826710.1 hypothetical protein [Candidatus Adiutrix intracellularis]
MLKKILPVLLLVLTLTEPAILVFAQAEDGAKKSNSPSTQSVQQNQNIQPGPKTELPQEIATALALEPPLSQVDVDIYLKILPELPTIMADPSSLSRIATAHDLSQTRFSYIMAKVPLTLVLIDGTSPEELGLNALPPVLHPTESEKAVVAQNREKLHQASNEALKTMGKLKQPPNITQ